MINQRSSSDKWRHDTVAKAVEGAIANMDQFEENQANQHDTSQGG